jgi:hypothetical protein
LASCSAITRARSSAGDQLVDLVVGGQAAVQADQSHDLVGVGAGVHDGQQAAKGEPDQQVRPWDTGRLEQGVQVADAVGAGVAARVRVAAAHVQAVVGADPGLAGQLGVDRLDIGAVAAQAMEVHDGRRPRGRGALTAQVELVATDVEGGVELADGRRLGCRRWRGRRAVGVVAGA